MSYKVRRLVVGKGKTTSDEKAGEWIKNYYELELEIPDEHELSIAKENAEGLLNAWLGIAEQSTKAFTWDPSKIKWVQTEGVSGPYERAEDADSLDFKNLLKDLSAHNGKFMRNGFFYWKFSRSPVVGRKKLEK